MIFLKAPRDGLKCLTTLPYKVLAKFSWTKTPQQRVLHIPVRLLCFGNKGWDLFSYPFCFMMGVGLVGELGEYTHTQLGWREDVSFWKKRRQIGRRRKREKRIILLDLFMTPPPSPFLSLSQTFFHFLPKPTPPDSSSFPIVSQGKITIERGGIVTALFPCRSFRLAGIEIASFIKRI